jgi:lysozyme family protein
MNTYKGYERVWKKAYEIVAKWNSRARWYNKRVYERKAKQRHFAVNDIV